MHLACYYPKELVRVFKAFFSSVFIFPGMRTHDLDAAFLKNLFICTAESHLIRLADRVSEQRGPQTD